MNTSRHVHRLYIEHYQCIHAVQVTLWKGQICNECSALSRPHQQRDFTVVLSRHMRYVLHHWPSHKQLTCLRFINSQKFQQFYIKLGLVTVCLDILDKGAVSSNYLYLISGHKIGYIKKTPGHINLEFYFPSVFS